MLEIREMRRADISSIALIEEAIFPAPWPEGVFSDELASSNRQYVVAADEGKIVGYGGLLTIAEDAHITTLAVVPETRRSRLGSKLMLALVDRAMAGGARHLTLEVRVSNAGAQRLYERFGFAPVGRRKGYYPDEDALVMWATDIDGTEYEARLESIRHSLEEARQ